MCNIALKDLKQKDFRGFFVNLMLIWTAELAGKYQFDFQCTTDEILDLYGRIFEPADEQVALKNRFRIFGDPVAYTAPKWKYIGKWVSFKPMCYSPPVYVHWKSTVAHQVRNSDAFEVIQSGPVFVLLAFYLNRPKSVKVGPHCKKPDLDNLCKGIFDAIKGEAIADDNQVFFIVASKCYATGKEPPGASIHIIRGEEVGQCLNLITGAIMKALSMNGSIKFGIR